MAKGKANKRQSVVEVKYIIGTDMHNMPIYCTHRIDYEGEGKFF